MLWTKCNFWMKESSIYKTKATTIIRSFPFRIPQMAHPRRLKSKKKTKPKFLPRIQMFRRILKWFRKWAASKTPQLITNSKIYSTTVSMKQRNKKGSGWQLNLKNRHTYMSRLRKMAFIRIASRKSEAPPNSINTLCLKSSIIIAPVKIQSAFWIVCLKIQIFKIPIWIPKFWEIWPDPTVFWCDIIKSKWTHSSKRIWCNSSTRIWWITRGSRRKSTRGWLQYHLCRKRQLSNFRRGYCRCLMPFPGSKCRPKSELLWCSRRKKALLTLYRGCRPIELMPAFKMEQIPQDRKMQQAFKIGIKACSPKYLGQARLGMIPAAGLVFRLQIIRIWAPWSNNQMTSTCEMEHHYPQFRWAGTP